MICPRCGAKFRLSDAKEEFETAYDGIDYEGTIEDRLCGYCAIQYMEDIFRQQDASIGIDYDKENTLYHEEDDDMPECCAACGNDAYPHCMDSCPLFDD